MTEITTQKHAGGRPAIVLNDEQVTQVEALAAVLSAELIADYFGIARRTFYDIMERQPEVHARYKSGKAKAIDSVAKGLLQKARDGDTASAIFYLKTQAGWRETQQIDHTTAGKELTGLTVTFVNATPKED